MGRRLGRRVVAVGSRWLGQPAHTFGQFGVLDDEGNGRRSVIFSGCRVEDACGDLGGCTVAVRAEEDTRLDGKGVTAKHFRREVVVETFFGGTVIVGAAGTMGDEFFLGDACCLSSYIGVLSLHVAMPEEQEETVDDRSPGH